MRSLLAILCLMTVGTLTSCSSTEEAPLSGTLRIGGLWSLTGPGMELDVPARNGAHLALKEINARGGVLGKQVELVDFDVHRDSATAANSVLNANPDIVSFIGLSDADPAIGAGKAALARNLPFITSGATYPMLPELAGYTTFLACFGDNVQAAAAAEYAFDTLKARKAYVLYNQSTTYTQALRSYFQTRWTELEGIIVEETAYDLGANELEKIAQKIAESKADLVFFSAVPDDIINGIRTMRAGGVTVPIMGGDGLDASIIEDLEASESNDVYFTTHTLISHGTSIGMSNFINNYKAEYGVEPISAFAALGCDAMKLMASEIEKAGSTHADSILNALETTTNFQGITGSISYSHQNHIPRKSVTVIRMRDRTYERAAEFVPRSIPLP